MKINGLNKILVTVLALSLCAAMEVYGGGGGGGGGGGRGGGGGGGGFGGFGGGRGGGGGGFGGGGFGGGGGASANGTGQYNNNGTVGTAQISVDPDTHNIIVIADTETTAQIKKVLDSLDTPQLQVLIKVVLMEVQLNNSSEIGVQGSYTGGSLGKSLAQITGYVTNFTVANPGTPTAAIVPTSITPTYQSFNMNNNFNLPQALNGSTGNGGIYQVLGNDFTATLQAIAAAGKAQILSRPSILARDGQLAEIFVGQSVYLPSGVSFTAVAGSATTIPNINGTYQNVGIQLDVTPFVERNNLVQMIIEPQIKSIDTSTPGQVIVGGSLISSAVYAPNINQRSANTVVVTPDSEPVVIGGLISSDRSSSDSKIPILGDIPFFGQLFKSSGKALTKTELIMFLTPHIVREPSDLSGLTSREMGQVPAITNSVTEQELEQFLEKVPVKKK